MPRFHTIVMVPKGAEYKAVEKGLNSTQLALEECNSVEIVSLPVGPLPVQSFLTQWCSERKLEQNGLNYLVIVMGLCGSLSKNLGIKDVVIYQQCLNGFSHPNLDTAKEPFDLFVPSNNFLIEAVTPVTGVMCDRVISKASEKAMLGQKFNADVVDMESVAAFQILEKYGVHYSMVRVVSDDAHHDLPDLNDAFSETGQIRPWVMARQFLLDPVGAVRLIRGSLGALATLEKTARQLFLSLEHL